MADHLVRLLTVDGTLRAAAADTTLLVEEMHRRQGTDPTATVALGRLMSGAALLGSLLKGDQRLALMVEGNGPLGKLHAETDAAGHLRGSLKVPVCGLSPKDGRFDVAGAVGRAGFLHVVKDLGLKEPYRGLVQLQSSEIAEDIAYYLTTSEQVPSTVALGVRLAADGSVAAAGGFLIQTLPGAGEAPLIELERRLAAAPAVTTMLASGESPSAILHRLFEGFELTAPQTTPLEFRCGCSRPQVLRMLATLGAAELEELSKRPEGVEVTCEFCKERYRFSPEDVAALGS